MIFNLLLTWILSALALMGVAYVMPSVHVENFKAALLAAVVLGLINALLRPVLVVMTFPLTVLTLGLFYVVLNGLLFWLAGSVTQSFRVEGFWSGVFGGVLYGLIIWLLTSVFARG
ncbi:phage holin family protein [Corticibacter populi]|uniref:Phage holin family protein n=1 Tax=Corticibacter populi TaxID=1550736 RepID=A0A3M6QK15_9BURK|nr:phage holin family protein [Corticibacter populi]RMX03444.1 phage holin family protein [Corticibacter populi]RZS29879.1 putative membrane protein [Corticibacter populi]